MSLVLQIAIGIFLGYLLIQFGIPMLLGGVELVGRFWKRILWLMAIAIAYLISLTSQSEGWSIFGSLASIVLLFWFIFSIKVPGEEKQPSFLKNTKDEFTSVWGKSLANKIMLVILALIFTTLIGLLIYSFTIEGFWDE